MGRRRYWPHATACIFYEPLRTLWSANSILDFKVVWGALGEFEMSERYVMRSERVNVPVMAAVLNFGYRIVLTFEVSIITFLPLGLLFGKGWAKEII